MSIHVDTDFAEMEKKLKCYVDRGRLASATKVQEQPMIAVKPDESLIRPLKKISSFEGSFVAVDCATRTLKRANNWGGICLMRPSYAIVKRRAVDWGFRERICTVVGDARTRSNYLTDIRIELESQMALELLNTRDELLYHEHSDPRSNYLMLDVGKALLISEPKIKFAVPVKVAHYPEYLEKLGKTNYGLPDAPKLSEMDERLKRLNEQTNTVL
jgi:hypothetical protein